MLFVVAVSILGSAFAIRMLNQLMHRNFFASRELTKIGTAYFLTVASLTIVLPRSRLSFWIAVFAPFCALALTLFTLVHRRSAKFRDSLCATLTLTALNMKAGRSFRQAFAEVVSQSEPQFRSKLVELSSVVVFSQQQRPSISSDPFLAEVIEELTLIDRQPHAAAKRLASFREKVRMENDFRRKSGQVLARIRVQSFIMTGLYVAMAAFMIWKFGWRQNGKLFLISAALFAGGMLWIWLGGRRLRWKV